MLQPLVEPASHIHDLLLAPGDPPALYALAGRLYRSVDGGATWQVPDREHWFSCVAWTGPTPTGWLAGTGRAGSFYAAMATIGVMYACSKNGENKGTGREGFRGTVMKSLRGGATWFPITIGLNVNQEFSKILVDTEAPDTVYLATQQEGVFVSRDSGALCLPWNVGLTNPVAGTNGNNVTNNHRRQKAIDRSFK